MFLNSLRLSRKPFIRVFKGFFLKIHLLLLRLKFFRHFFSRMPLELVTLRCSSRTRSCTTFYHLLMLNHICHIISSKVYQVVKISPQFLELNYPCHVICKYPSFPCSSGERLTGKTQHKSRYLFCKLGAHAQEFTHGNSLFDDVHCMYIFSIAFICMTMQNPSCDDETP